MRWPKYLNGSGDRHTTGQNHTLASAPNTSNKVSLQKLVLDGGSMHIMPNA
ncbi:MAG: hypothetical protein AAFY20_08970 [Cyanobacteria bacterium J06639_14]